MMLMTAIDFSLIRPDCSGKYSPLLYKWLTHKSRKPWHYQHVFQCHDRIEGNSKYADNWRSRELIIGHGEINPDGRIVGIGGRSIGDIICGVRGAMTQGYFYSAAFGLRDITDQFWKEYIRIGRCAWDHAHQMHMIGDDDRYHYHSGGNGRRCNWCGREFEVERRMIVDVHQREEWKDYRSSVHSVVLSPMGSLGEAA